MVRELVVLQERSASGSWRIIVQDRLAQVGVGAVVTTIPHRIIEMHMTCMNIVDVQVAVGFVVSVGFTEW